MITLPAGPDDQSGRAPILFFKAIGAIDLVLLNFGFKRLDKKN
ncbi:hypothetical protein [Rhizobium sp. LC145]|nr:hypothetical protein [Rhizobium sp. LC145]